jgi:hypothetical protein
MRGGVSLSGSFGQQPKWAWWVVGIAVPLLGTAVALLAMWSPQSSPTPEPSTGQTHERAPAEAPSPHPSLSPKVRYGPGDIVVESAYGGSDEVDLDSVPPLVSSTDMNGTDLGFDPTLHEPVDVGGDHDFAPLPGEGPEPDEAACVDQLRTNGTGRIELERGVRFCAQTSEGRTAYIRVIAAPVEGAGIIRLEVTVWEVPD